MLPIIVVFQQTKEKDDDKENSEEQDDKCYELESARDRIYRTHPFYLDYDETQELEEGDVTLVAQLSMDRLGTIFVSAMSLPRTSKDLNSCPPSFSIESKS